MDQEYQDAGSEFEQRSGEDLQALEDAQNYKQMEKDLKEKEHMEFVKNCYNDFMVLFFEQGYSYVEASKKSRQAVDEILNDAEESKEEIEANKEGSPFDNDL